MLPVQPGQEYSAVNVSCVGQVVYAGAVSVPPMRLVAPGATVFPPSIVIPCVNVNPSLTVTNATDPEGQPLTYGFRVYSDALLTQLAASVDGVASGVGTTPSSCVE